MTRSSEQQDKIMERPFAGSKNLNAIPPCDSRSFNGHIKDSASDLSEHFGINGQKAVHRKRTLCDKQPKSIATGLIMEQLV
eukprot:1295703-Karenia_brevis.AAC.1